MNTINKFDISVIEGFANTLPDVKNALKSALYKKSFVGKILSTVGINNTKLKTQENISELFHQAIVIANNFTSTYKAYGDVHESKIKSLEERYKEYVAFLSQYKDDNREQNKAILKQKLFTTRNKDSTYNKMMIQLKMYPIPLQIVIDIIDIIQNSEYISESSRVVISDFRNNKISILYQKGLKNPNQRSDFLEYVKLQYTQLHSIEELSSLLDSFEKKSQSPESNIEMTE